MRKETILAPLAALFALGALAALLYLTSSDPRDPKAADAPRAPLEMPRSIEEVERFQGGKGVQAFISYTARGFEPARLGLRAGERVRFTNNAAADVALSFESGGYCGEGEECVVRPQEFLEIELWEKGELRYAGGAFHGVITVK